MQEHQTHGSHAHVHGPGCGHAGIRHNDHVDYAHDGHLHHVHDGHVDECRIEVDSRHTVACANGHACKDHDTTHRHGAGCGHEAVPHGDHTDYLVAGHLHHAHNGHCDHHGTVERV
jgi:hypothetical protein